MKPTAVLNALNKIVMTIWKKSPADRAFAEQRIRRHYELFNLEARGAEIADVRPTPWHGEGGRSGDNNTGHLTVAFKDASGNHITTHHVYKDDTHY